MVAVDRDRDGVEATQRERVSLLEAHHQIVAGVGAEVLHDDSQRPDRALEITAGAGEFGGMLNGFEGIADVGFAGDIGEPIGDESDHRN